MTSDEMYTLVCAVGAHLEGYEPAPQKVHCHWQMLRGPDGREIAFHLDSYRHKLSIAGEVPRYDADKREIGFYTRLERPAIKVGEGRTPEAIAREVKRRLLPDYEAYWAEFAKCRASHDSYHASQSRIAEAMVHAGVATRDAPCAATHGADLTVKLVLPDEVWGKVKLGRESIHLDLHDLSEAQAIAALRAIQGAR